jgi:glycosyltransferase involved in cell wall biosynthesis
MSRPTNQNKINILIFTLSPPLPANSGGPIYITNTLIPLAEKYNLHLYVIGGLEEMEYVRKHKSLYDKYFCSVHIEPRAVMPQRKKFIGKLFHAIEHIFFGLPFMDVSYYSRSAVRNAKKIVAERSIQLMEIHSSHLAFFKKFLPKIPSLLVSHNIESDIFPFWIPQNSNGFKKILKERVARISRKNSYDVEIKNKWKFEHMTFISANDMARVTAPEVEKTYIPLCLPVKNINYMSKVEPPIRLLWMGGFWWHPNAEGILWFVQCVLPLIKDKLIPLNIQLHFIGAVPPDELVEIHDGKNIIVHGFVESIEDLLAETHLLFVPLLTGGGVRVKILEAMANGIPVISTSKGCEGLGATDGVDIVIRDDAKSFAEAMIDLAQSCEKRSQLSIASQRLLDEKYNLMTCINIKDTIYQKLAHESDGGAIRLRL